MTIGVIIPVYRNRDVFITNLKNNIDFLGDCTIVVVDDFPDESIEQEVKKISKKIHIIKNKKNLGFGSSINQGAFYLKTDLLFLLNSDVKLNNAGFYDVTDDIKERKELFAVSFLQKDKKDIIVGKNKIYFKRGMVFHKKAKNFDYGLNSWAEGGSCIIRKTYFDILGGFDSIYSPFYWEDIDLSYRAYKCGWDTIFDPFIKVEHQHESTISKYFSKQVIKKIAYRNQFIFIWKNISDIKLVISHLLLLPYYFIFHLLKNDSAFFTGFFEALSKIPEIISARNKNSLAVRCDSEIFSLFTTHVH